MGVRGEGGRVEVATVGREGVVGLPILFDARIAAHQGIVRLRGDALRIGAAALRTEIQRHEPTRSLFLAYAHRVSSETAQAVVCQCFHNVLQRLCRWLLIAADSTGASTLEVTQESIAAALGVVRSVVTKAAVELQDADAIRCRHGRLVIRNPILPRRTACECYEVMRPTRARDFRASLGGAGASRGA